MRGLVFKQGGAVGLSEEAITEHEAALESYREELGRVVTERDTSVDEASITLPDADQGVIAAALHTFEEDPLKYVVVVGIGGSNLGTQAIYEALRQGNEAKDDVRLVFVDTTSSRNTAHALRLLKDLDSETEMVINVISKSGSTTETMANIEVMVAELGGQFPGILDRVVVTTDEGSALWNSALEQSLLVLPIDKKVGGRYSVFSSVGIFPLALAGIDTGELLLGAQDARESSLKEGIGENPAMMRAVLTHLYDTEGLHIHNSFFFNPELEFVGRWWRQLVGESLGKKHDVEGEEVRNGITPIVSIGSTDLHSMAQLYLGGPRDKFTSFIYAESPNEGLVVPENSVFDMVSGIGGKGIQDLMTAIYGGVKRAYEKEKLPFVEIELESVSAYTLGALLQTLMIEVMYLAQLANVNAFDQPSVELYKEETREILQDS